MASSDVVGRKKGSTFTLTAEALVRQDPMVASGCVDWQLQGWIPSVGDLATDLVPLTR